MSHNPRRCVDPECPCADSRISDAEDARDFPEPADYQDHAERAFDRMGGERC